MLIRRRWQTQSPSLPYIENSGGSLIPWRARLDKRSATAQMIDKRKEIAKELKGGAKESKIKEVEEDAKESATLASLRSDVDWWASVGVQRLSQLLSEHDAEWIETNLTAEASASRAAKELEQQANLLRSKLRGGEEGDLADHDVLELLQVQDQKGEAARHRKGGAVSAHRGPTAERAAEGEAQRACLTASRCTSQLADGATARF